MQFSFAHNFNRNNPRHGNDEDASGRMIWHRFTNVVILDEQMRQAQDPAFQNLLRRARAASLTEEDLNLLNTKVATSLITPELENATTIVKLNALRHHINRVKLDHFARSRSQRIYIFPAQHSRVASASSSNLRVEDLLQQTDDGTKVPFQGLFSYTPGVTGVRAYGHVVADHVAMGLWLPKRYALSRD